VQFEKDKENDQMIVSTKDKEVSFILFAGQPLGEPVA
jgi:redox-sensitive bicupin YhaK (pirin superfamily)